MRPQTLVLSAVASLFLASAAWAVPAGQVQLEIAGDNSVGAAMSFQQWGQALAAAGVQNFRLRSGQTGDKPSIEVGGTEQMPLYKVTAVLGTGDVLVVPGGKFRRTECKKLAAWLDDLAKRGPPDKREKISAFGLTASQLEKVNSDLSKAVGFSTKGMTRSEAVTKIGGQLGLSLKVEGTLADDDKIEEELSGFSSGTALACILRPIGFCMVPQADGETLSHLVRKTQLDKEIWPVGWPAEGGAEGPASLVRVPQRERLRRDGGQAPGRGRQAGQRAGALRPQRAGPARHRARQGDRFASPGANDLQHRAAEDAGEGWKAD